MNNHLLMYAEAKLLFREAVYKFVEGAGDTNLLFTTVWNPSLLVEGAIYIYDNQAKIIDIRKSTNTEFTVALHSFRVRYETSSASDKERAGLIAEKLDAYFLSLHGSRIKSGAIELEVSKYESPISHCPSMYVCDCSYEIVKN